MLLLKDRGLVECLDKPEWAQKFPQKLRDRDWALMENIVGVLKVRFGVGSPLNDVTISCTIFKGTKFVLLKNFSTDFPRDNGAAEPRLRLCQ